MDYTTKRVWTEVDPDRIVGNYNYIRSVIGADCKLCAVVKANAYGHGTLRVAKALETAGADMFAVACVSEAMELRENGIASDIIVLGRTEPEDVQVLCDNNIIQTVYSFDYATELSALLIKSGRKLKIHLKVDTGMNRIGFDCRNSDNIQRTTVQILEIVKQNVFDIQGIFSHFAVSDRKNDIFNAIQYRNFLSLTGKLTRAGINIPIRHICNSDGVFNFPNCHMEMVRTGIALYGTEGNPHLKPAMSLKCSVIHVHRVPAGECISYGCSFKAPKDMKVATLSIGYADGLPRAWADRGYVLIDGKRAKIVGRICMDQCMVDVSGINCKAGDVATIFGSDGGEALSVKKMADAIGTISYEILCSFDRKRIYTETTVNDKP